MEQNENADKTLIESVLKGNGHDIAFEPIPEENDSPLAQAVIDKNNHSADANASKATTTTTETKSETAAQNTPPDETKEQTQNIPKQEEFDAPEQEINENPEDESLLDKDENGNEFTVPLVEAKLMADTILGVVNNTIIEVGAGYFVTIPKHKDFYDFDELIQVIDEQNVKNIKRIKLDAEDKALLRPLIIRIIRKKAKVVSVEGQLITAIISLAIKKGRVIMEMRDENEILVERIREIIRKEIQGNTFQEEETENNNATAQQNSNTEKSKQEVTEVIYEEILPKNKTGLPPSVLETYE